MEKHQKFSRHNLAILFLGGLLILLGTSNVSLAQIDTNQLNDQTVRITVWHSTGFGIGSGTVICNSGGTINVLTAAHVLYGSQTRADGTSEPRYKKISKIRVEFHHDRWPAIEGPHTEFRRRKASGKDLGLLSFPAGDRPVPAITIGKSAEVHSLDKVYTTGHSLSLNKKWFLKSGEINEAGEFLLYSVALESGYSGGPVVDSSGSLIGLNVRVNRAAEGGVTAQAIPIDEAVATLRTWMDINCLQYETTATDTESSASSTPCRITNVETAKRCFDRLYAVRTTAKQPYLDWIRNVERIDEQEGFLTVNDQTTLAFWTLMLAEIDDGDEVLDLAAEIDTELIYFGIVDDTATGSGSAAAGDPLTGSWSVVQMQDILGVVYTPPSVSGYMTVSLAGAAQYNLSMNISFSDGFQTLNLQQQVSTTLGNNILAGTITASNMGMASMPWRAQVNMDAVYLYLSLDDNTIWAFQRN